MVFTVDHGAQPLHVDPVFAFGLRAFVADFGVGFVGRVRPFHAGEYGSVEAEGCAAYRPPILVDVAAPNGWPIVYIFIQNNFLN